MYLPGILSRSRATRNLWRFHSEPETLSAIAIFAPVAHYTGTDHYDPWTNMSTECNRIAYQLASTLNGEAWYGDSLRQILKDVTAKQAQTNPIPNAHSIWELLCHMEAWVKFALGAVSEAPIPAWPAMPVELDWPAITDT